MMMFLQAAFVSALALAFNGQEAYELQTLREAEADI